MPHALLTLWPPVSTKLHRSTLLRSPSSHQPLSLQLSQSAQFTTIRQIFCCLGRDSRRTSFLMDASHYECTLCVFTRKCLLWHQQTVHWWLASALSVCSPLMHLLRMALEFDKAASETIHSQAFKLHSTWRWCNEAILLCGAINFSFSSMSRMNDGSNADSRLHMFYHSAVGVSVCTTSAKLSTSCLATTPSKIGRCARKKIISLNLQKLPIASNSHVPSVPLQCFLALVTSLGMFQKFQTTLKPSSTCCSLDGGSGFWKFLRDNNPLSSQRILPEDWSILP